MAGATTQACADEPGETKPRSLTKAPVESARARDTQTATARSLSRTMWHSSRMEKAPAELVSLAGEMWSVTHARNSSGSFLLVRNASPPHSARVLTVSLGAAPAQTLAPRETLTWGCDALDGHATLRVHGATGKAVFAGKAACGDAVYLSSVVAP